MAPSADSLIQLSYRYYPRLGDALYRLPAQEYDELYQATPEFQALFAAQQKAIQDRTRWRALLTALVDALPANSLMDSTRGYSDVCYTARIEIGTHETATEGTLCKELVMSMSFLAPLYLLYESHFHERGTRDEPEYGPTRILLELSSESTNIAHILERKIATMFGYERLDPSVGATIVPDIQVGYLEPGEASLMDALFTDSRW